MNRESYLKSISPVNANQIFSSIPKNMTAKIKASIESNILFRNLDLVWMYNFQLSTKMNIEGGSVIHIASKSTSENGLMI